MEHKKRTGGMKVSVDANFTLKGIFETPLTLSFQSPRVTLRDALREIDRCVHAITLFQNHDLGDDIEEVWLNGKRFFSLREKLDTRLKDGDALKIALYIAPLGGG